MATPQLPPAIPHPTILQSKSLTQAGISRLKQHFLTGSNMLPKLYTMSSKKDRRLQELRGSDFEVAEGQPDIRGWEVRDESGRLIGKVDELIFDSRENKVRYMVVNVRDSDELELEKRTVLVPIGLAVLEHKHDDVILQGVTPFQLRALPRYNKEDLGTKAERAISTVFGRTDTPGYTGDDADLQAGFYQHDHFNEKNMFRKRNNSEGATFPAEKRNDNNRAASQDGRKEERIYREEEIGTPASYVDPVEAERLNTARDSRSAEADEEAIRRAKQAGDQPLHRETDEEYVRRARRNVDNRDSNN
jgi:sporulation protein YlmC with PRC-barrel domain